MTTFLLYGKKVIYEDQSLDATALRGWLEVEEGLAGCEASTITGLYSVVRWALSTFDPDHFLPKHGGGSVAEGTRSVVEKCRLIQPDSQLDYIFERSNLSTSEDFSAYPWLMGNASIDPSQRRRAKLIFVPKDLKKTRSICMEPTVLQWAQQGVRLWLEKAIETGPLRHFIVLDDQSENRAFAQYGSLTSLVDTIDLSSASDSVRTEVIRANFQPQVLKYLLATRSTTVELPDGTTFEPLKFAPMGSSLCFPVQCILYTCIVLLAGITYRLGGEALTDDLSITEVDRLVQLSFADTLGSRSDYKLQPLRVFGDDIICDSKITSLVISYLNTLGFLVNIDKSFRGDSAFRESCGGYYLFGRDVTPERFKGIKVDDDGKTLPESVLGLIDHANDLYRAGLMNARRHVVQYVLYGSHRGYMRTQSGVNQILFSSDPDDAQSIYHPQPKNSHLRLRMWDGETLVSTSVTHANSHIAYQRMEVRSSVLGSMPRRSQSYVDDYLWGVWWRGKYGDTEVPSSIGEPVSRADTTKMVVRWRWTPTV